MLKKWLFATCVVASSMSSAYADYTPFTLSLNYQGGLSTSQLAIFENARQYWENQIIGYDGPVNFQTGLTIDTIAQAIDGQGGVLGSAGPTGGYYNTGAGLNGKLYATQGSMQFDTADINWLEGNGRLIDVVIHELAHVIGFGTLWTHNGLYTTGSGQYTGSYAVNMYQNEFSATTNYIPVELNAGAGSDEGHWAENWLGGTDELMTSFLNNTPFMSLTSLASFRDLGYAMAYTLDTVDAPSDVSIPFGAGALLAGFFFMRRRQTQK